MANAFIALCYATAKKAGVDTSKMSVDEVVEWYNKHKQHNETKDKLKQSISKVKETQDSKNKTSDNKKTNQNAKPIKKHKDIVDFVDRTDQKAVHLNISKYCDYLSNQKEEHCILIDKDGDIWDIKGDGTFVNMPEEANLDGAIAMHNHLELHSFSDDDINTILANKNTECILVDKNYIYKAKGLKDNNLGKHYYGVGLQKMLDEHKDYSEVNHFVMEEMKKDGLVQYERIPKKSN